MITKTLEFANPSEIYEKLHSENSVLLESQKNGSYSYIALNPYMIFKSKENFEKFKFLLIFKNFYIG